MYAQPEGEFFLTPVSTIPNSKQPVKLTLDALTEEPQPLSSFDGFEDCGGFSIVKMTQPDGDHRFAAVQVKVVKDTLNFSVSRLEGSPAYSADNVFNVFSDCSFLGCVREGADALEALEAYVASPPPIEPADFSHDDYLRALAVTTGKHGDPLNWA